jgi:bisphosphoglycerate-dependent phosphoglycerate mutase
MNAKKRARQERAVERLAKAIAMYDSMISNKELETQIKKTMLRAKSCAVVAHKNTLKNLGLPQ